MAGHGHGSQKPHKKPKPHLSTKAAASHDLKEGVMILANIVVFLVGVVLFFTLTYVGYQWLNSKGYSPSSSLLEFCGWCIAILFAAVMISRKAYKETGGDSHH